jgi:hypothetical protein
VEWYLAGVYQTTDMSVSGSTDTSSWSHTFSNTGTYEVKAIVYDTQNDGDHVGYTTWSVTTLTKGYGAWIYGKESSYVTAISDYNGISSANNKIKYLFCRVGGLDLSNQQVDGYDTSVTSFYKTNLPDCKVYPMLDASGNLSTLTPDEIDALAQRIADKINSDSNADGVHLDIEPYNDKLVDLVDKLNDKTSKPVTVAIGTASPKQELFTSASIVVLMNYDIGTNPTLYEVSAKQRANDFLAMATSAGGYGMIGLPAIATHHEYKHRINKSDGREEQSGYIMIDYLVHGINGVNDAVTDNDNEHYIGISIWSLINEPIGIYDTGGWEYYPYEITTDEWKLLEGANAKIASGSVASGIFRPGDAVEATITIENTGDVDYTFYVGYSVKNPDGDYLDAPYTSVNLPVGNSKTVTLDWTVPDGAIEGSYDAIASIWMSEFETSLGWLHGRLDSKDKTDAFAVERPHERRTIEFSELTWDIRPGSESPQGPGNNYWSNSTENIWVDEEGQLHLNITYKNGKWYCPEIISQESFGYGKYYFFVSSRVDELDKNVVGGLFTYLDDNNEIDIEFSKWGQSTADNSQYVVQPYYHAGNTHRFNTQLNGDYSTHCIDWHQNHINFFSLHGHYCTPPDSGYIIDEWEYTGGDIPTTSKEKVHLNLWLMNGNPPSDGQSAEMIVKEFKFEPEEPKWTFMVFLNGDGNLENHSIEYFNQLEEAANNLNVSIVVQLDRIPGYDDSNGDWTDTRRYKVKYDIDQSNFASYTENVDYWDLGEKNMCNQQTLINFVNWAKLRYPADHYCLIIFTHGGGWIGMSGDQTDGGCLSTADFGSALDSVTSHGANKLDVVYLDSCRMQMIEVEYQIKDFADYLVGSENIVWTSWQYKDCLSSITSTTTPEEVANIIVDNFTVQPYTISAVDLNKLNNLESAVDNFAQELISGLPAHKAQIENSWSACQKFDSKGDNSSDCPGKDCDIDNNDTYIDLYHFAYLIKQNIPNSTIQIAAQNVIDCVDSAVIAEEHKSASFHCKLDNKSHYYGLDDAHGISIYFLPTDSDPCFSEYNNANLEFVTDTQWDEFLRLYSEPCGNMGVNPTSWCPSTLICGNSDSETVTVSASGGPVEGVTVSKISGPTWLTLSQTNLGDIASGSSETFTMTASPPAETSGDFTYTVRVSNTCGSPTTRDVTGTIHVTTGPIFEDNFSELNLDAWIPFGSPSPRVLASAEGRENVFDNNGDSWCNNGVVSKDNFSLTNGFTMESDMYLKVTSVAGCWNSPVIGLTRQNTPTGEGECPTESYPMGAIFGIEYDGDACWATPEEKRRHAYFIIGLYTEEGTWESVSWLNADDYIDEWHNFKIVVGSDRIVKFYVDDTLIYTSTKKINETVLQEKKIFLGIRSSGSAGKSYHDFIKVYATPATIDQILDDFSELNLDTWIPFGSPSPQVLASAEGREGVFDNNGDSWCNSGVVSKDNFSFTNGFTMESDMYLKVTSVAGCWNSPVIGLTRQNTPTGEGVCPTESYPEGVIFGIEYDGDACWATPEEKRRHAYFIIGLYTEEGTWESVSWLNADDYIDEWHNFKIVVGSDRIVKFYVDNDLIYTSEKRINETVLQEKKIFLGIRSSGSAGKSYHDFIKVYATTQENQSPIANFTYTPENPVVTQIITFNASSAYDPGGTITKYEWNFGDGNVTNTTGPIITHSYASEGDYTVNLKVTDDNGATNTTTKLITVTRLCGDIAPYPNSNGKIDVGDVILLLNNVSHPGNSTYVLCNDWAGDCRCTGVRNMGDVVLLLNNVSYPENTRYVLDCC